MAESSPATGPDFSLGISLSDCPQEGTIPGRVGDTAVLLSRLDGEFFAISATCTHYGGPLAEGLVGRTDVRCPLHHACFDLKTGAVLRAPALDPVDRWRVEVEGGRLFVREKLPSSSHEALPQSEVQRIIIIGGGAAGLACAIELRKLGYDGTLTILSEDEDPPYDRPNLSKDYLAGTALEEWMPLRDDDWYSMNNVELRLRTRVDELDTETRKVRLGSGDALGFDRLLLATGSEPRRLEQDGFSGPSVFTLRTFADARAIIGRAKPNSRAVILGSSFIGLEAAAALRKRDIDVTIIAP
jgi:nitrite reductase/ring-hydroxylating ferredoxin subunit